VLDFFASLMSLLHQDDVICGKRIKKEERDVWAVEVDEWAGQRGIRSRPDSAFSSFFSFMFLINYMIFLFQIQIGFSNSKCNMNAVLRNINMICEVHFRYSI
jgi:hypothetical protein